MKTIACFFVLLALLALVVSVPVWSGESRVLDAGDAWLSAQATWQPQPSVPEGAAYADDVVLVRFRPEAAPAQIQATQIALEAETIHVFTLVPGLVAMRLPDDGATVEQAIKKLSTLAYVDYAEPDYRLTAIVEPDDTYWEYLWGMKHIRAPKAWNTTTGNQNVIVAIIDTGIDYTHPDLAANIWTNPNEIAGNGVDDDGNGYVDDLHGWNFVVGSNDPMDDHGHGTHTAGTVGAVGNNAIGVVGVNWHVKLMALKFIRQSGGGWTSDAARALEYATLMGARVSNNSYGSEGHSQALYDAIQSAQAAGHLFVAAAGNKGSNTDITPFYPAAYDLNNIISVAAINSNENLAVWSNYGALSVDLGAPGVDILSTYLGGSYTWMSGTSMAAPHVAGAAALLIGRYPSSTYTQIRDRILGGTRPLASLSGMTVTGGSLDVAAALTGATPTPTPTPPTAPSVIEVNTTADVDPPGACEPKTANRECSLREALILANLAPGKQVIHVPAGVYRLSIPTWTEDPSQEDPAVGDLDLKDDVDILGVGSGVAVVDAGGRYRVFHIMAGVAARIERLTIQHGESNNGGGISTNGPTTLVNVTLAYNFASDFGGALHMQRDQATLVNCTLKDNGAGWAGDGIAQMGGTLKAFNTLIANPGYADDCFGDIAEKDHILIEDGTCNPALSGDPGLGPYRDGYFAPQAGSQVIDAGNDATCAIRDQLDQARVDGNGDGRIVCDIGAIEYQVVPAVTPARFRGVTYRGPSGDHTQTLPGVRLWLYGRQEGEPPPGRLVEWKSSDGSGFFSFYVPVPEAYAIYRLVAESPVGMTGTGVWSEDGTILDNLTVEWVQPRPEVHLNEFFFDIPTATPTVTPTASRTPTPTRTATPSRTPTPSAAPSQTPTHTATVTPSVTPTPSSTLTPTPSATLRASPTPTVIVYSLWLPLILRRPASTATLQWSEQEVYAYAGSAVEEASLALDADDRPHIAFMTTFPAARGYSLRYARFAGSGGNCGSGGAWTCDGLAGWDISAGGVALAIDGAGEPRISYAAPSTYAIADLRYAYPVPSEGNCRVDSHWNCDRIDGVRHGTSLAVDHEDRSHIAYSTGIEETTAEVRYAHDVGSGGNCGPSNSWQCDTVMPGDVDGGDGIALALDSSGKPSMCLVMASELRFVRFSGQDGNCGPGDSWQCETIDVFASSCSVAFDSHDNPHILYGTQAANAGGGLKYAIFVGEGGNCGARGRWRCEALNLPNYAGSATALVLDSHDRPHLAYWDGVSKDMIYARWAGSGHNCGPQESWLCEPIPNTAMRWPVMALVLDQGDLPHAAYVQYPTDLMIPGSTLMYGVAVRVDGQP